MTEYRALEREYLTSTPCQSIVLLCVRGSLDEFRSVHDERGVRIGDLIDAAVAAVEACGAKSKVFGLIMGELAGRVSTLMWIRGSSNRDVLAHQ